MNWIKKYKGRITAMIAAVVIVVSAVNPTAGAVVEKVAQGALVIVEAVSQNVSKLW